MGQRILTVLLPRLPTDRIARIRWGASWRSAGRPEHPPVAISARIRNAMRLCALDELAARVGLRIGQGVAEARACLPELDVIEADPNADLRLLESLADWCGRYTPLVALHGDKALFLDVTGCCHLFGGERALFDDLAARLFHMGFEARLAISATPGLSYAMALSGRQQVLPTGEEAAMLRGLPLAALRLEIAVLDGLAQAGLKRAGDIMDLPRAPLARRFGPAVLTRLDQALGREGEPVSPRLPVAALSAERQLAEPVTGEEDILALAEHLAGNLEETLTQRGLGGLNFALTLYRVDGKVVSITVRSPAPLKTAARIAGLFRERLAAIHDDFDAGYGFETVRLAVLVTGPLAPTQPDFASAGRSDLSLDDFVGKVEARLGGGVIRVPVLNESHVPERASALAPYSRDDSPQRPGWPARLRPMRLFAHPEPVEAIAEVPEGPPITFRWRRTFHRVSRAEGPERIEAEWWIDGEAASPRDYFRIEDQGGRRFWLYREGLYGVGALPPRWFMHGVFA
ncbi:Y-family DNA polymerase [Rhizobium sp. C4]|uniref:Y-family DNA polymerase n=1 Tax=Rhizobium sp. C4 TaxID=1349800 RepID=UPI001E40BABB|nr:DNA polymerase Y family protein [Rhizobium sp. C4]